MNILFLSCHIVLEKDEVSLLTDLGHNVFSMGGYQINNSGNNLRGPIPNLFQDEHLKYLSMQCSKENLHPELIEWADVILSMHNSRVEVENHPQAWIANNWEKMKHKKVVWRTIGQSTKQIEECIKPFRAQGLKIVRYSPKEKYIPSFAGEDAMIRFYKDPDEYQGWTGSTNRVVNVSQAMFGGNSVHSRGDHMAIEVFKQAVEGLDWKIYGPDNENAGEHNGGLLSFDDLKNMYRFNRVYLYTGTRPASYTLGFIEAMITGMPIVSIGPEHGNAIYTDQKTFEAHEFLEDGCGLWSDNPRELNRHLTTLLNDYDMAKEISRKAREKAIQLFGKETVSKQWEAFLKSL